jgi:hypothetical protein
MKQGALFMPVDATDNAPQVSLIETVDWREKKDLFLNVRREIEQFHDLRHAGSRNVAAPGQVRVVANRSLPNQSLEPDGEGHQPGYPWNGDPGLNITRRSIRRFAGTKINCVRDFSVPVHACTSGWNRMEIRRALPS